MTGHTGRYVHDVCRGYNDRAREIAIGDKGRPRRAATLAEYLRLNSAVDQALLLIEDEPVRVQIKRALVEGTGYDSQYQIYCGRRQFYTCKRRVVAGIARILNLTE